MLRVASKRLMGLLGTQMGFRLRTECPSEPGTVHTGIPPQMSSQSHLFVCLCFYLKKNAFSLRISISSFVIHQPFSEQAMLLLG